MASRQWKGVWKYLLGVSAGMDGTGWKEEGEGLRPSECPDTRHQFQHEQAREDQTEYAKDIRRRIAVPGWDPAFAGKKLEDEIGEDGGDVHGDEGEDAVVPVLGRQVAFGVVPGGRYRHGGWRVRVRPRGVVDMVGGEDGTLLGCV